MAQPPPERIAGNHGFRNLGLRLRSAAVLAPPVFAGIYFGSPWFDVLIVLAGGVMAWEWATMCSSSRFDLVGWLMEAGIAACLISLYAGNPALSLLAAAIVVIVVMGVAAIRRHDSPARLGMGAGIISVFCLSFVWLRALPDTGLELVIWLVVAVWFTDAGGYFFGKMIGGPKLAPRISPNKTWAGLAGGILLATLWSVAALSWGGGHAIGPAMAAAVGIAVLAQLGDLSVSAVKRRFGVKDTSGLIPGHGGVLDRLDGMLLTGPTAAFVLVLYGKGWI
ncbi:MAG: phosphatidate cytidylyltransferase [Paracoccaceae bacterium]|jgi:phosphatidate cytidylyltransferase